MNLPSKTPAKLIISGEHAVLYGAPAIAGAVNYYAQTQITENTTQKHRFICPALKLDVSLSSTELSSTYQQLAQRYNDFLQHKISVSDILSSPLDLCAYTFQHCLEQIDIIPTTGLDIKIDIDIPLGSGMGSSAALIISLKRALCQHYHKSLAHDVLLKAALNAENLQHGQSSGLDINICYFGGLSHYQHKTLTPMKPTTLPFYIINTGKPDCSTGECVQHVKEQNITANLWQDFTSITNKLTQALYQQDQKALSQAIDDNHQLLCKIDVVPNTIKQFITTLNHHNIAAKICGAGAIRGNNAGMLICTMNDSVATLCEEHHYSFTPLELVPRHD